MDERAILGWSRGAHGDPPSLRLIDAHIVDPERGEPIASGYVEVTDGRIAAVGPMASLAGHAETEISLAGRTIIPGLIDAHVHLVYSGYALFRAIGAVSAEVAAIDASINAEKILSAGYTTVRDLGTIGNVAVAIRDAVRRRRIPGPRILASGRVISSSRGPQYQAEGDGAGFTERADGVDEVVRTVRRQIAAGVDNIKLMASGVEANEWVDSTITTYSREEIAAAVAEAHAAGKTVAVHAQSYDSATYALSAGADTVEHGNRLNDEALSLLAKGQTVLVPTLSTLYSVKELGQDLNLLAKHRDEMASNEGAWLESLNAAHAVGALIAAGGDVGNRYAHGQNAKEIGHLSRSGFTPAESLGAATIVAARALRIESSVGSLAVGKIADMVVLAQDPLGDVDILQDPGNIVLVIQNGLPTSGSVYQG